MSRATTALITIGASVALGATGIALGVSGGSSRAGADPGTPWDVVVYGATPGGVVAAIEAARLGKQVALVEPSQHVGGMVTGGLSHTDVGTTPGVIGGLAREYFSRASMAYNSAQLWDFEPHVAQQVMNDMLAQSGVHLFTGEPIVLGPGGVTMDGTTITSLVTTTGDVFAGSEFIDASYEGDLMADAGVSYTVGRESTDEYGESGAGVQTFSNDYKVSLPAGVDATVSPAVASYAEIDTTALPTPGSADNHIQPYNYRVTSTNVAANRVPYPMPENYDPARYALLAAWLPKLQTYLKRPLQIKDVLTMTPMKNGKYDTNSASGFSTDFLNGSFGYPDGSYTQRAQIAQATQDYDEGLLYFLQNDPSVPISLHNAMALFGLAADEFTDNANWPTQLYVREARRMVAPRVLTQQDLQSGTVADDTIALGSYRIDEHSGFRGVDANGFVQNEGSFSLPISSAYGVPYGVITPSADQVTNLLVTGTPSVSHVAWASLRMEPQLMMLGQTAADAAVLAITAQSSVQDVPVATLRATLLAQGAILTVGQKSTVIVDDADSTSFATTGAWSPGSTAPGCYGPGYLQHPAATDGATATWTTRVTSNGAWKAYVRYPGSTGNTTAAKFSVTDASGVQRTYTVNERVNGSTWVYIGTYNLKSTVPVSVVLSTLGVKGTAVADAVEFVH